MQMETKFISSLQNPFVKEVVKLSEKSSERHKRKQFIVEGRREVSLAIQAGYRVISLVVCSSLYQPDTVYPIPFDSYKNLLVEVSENVYARMAYRSNAEGIMAVMEMFDTSLDKTEFSATPFLVVLEAVEKPGNLGAILRTADAAGVDAVVICDPTTDVFNPNVIRSSLGCFFSVKISVCNTEQWFKWASYNGIITMLASVQAEKPYFDVDFRQPLALVFGTEADGLSPVWYENADEILKIPMGGKIDSLNVSASAAIMVFEAVRQRKQLKR
jgi:RNA methyltransferase, TrmH family